MIFSWLMFWNYVKTINNFNSKRSDGTPKRGAEPFQDSAHQNEVIKS